MKKILAILALSFCFTSVSQAGWMFEPYLGYEFGKMKDNLGGETTATNLGLRVAYTLPVLVWFGLDGTQSLTGNFKADTGPNSDLSRTTIYGVVGVDLPILLRAWAGVSLSNEMKFKDYGDNKLKGNGYKLGVGFTALPFVSLNLEYINDTFTEFGGVSASPDAKHSSYMLSVSLPL